MLKKAIFALIAVTLLALVLSAAFLPSAAKQSDRDNKKAPKFTLENLQGEKVSLTDYEGKVVLINFWATWCGPCVKEIPELIKLRNNYKDNDFEVLGIVVSSRENQVKDMVKNFEISYPVLWGTQKVVDDFGPIRGIPRTFIIDQEGNIVEDLTGSRSYDVFESLIKKYIKS